MRPGTKVFMSSDHGNKKGLHHLVKVMSLWSEEENSVKQITLDTDASGGTSDDTADRIDVSLSKLDAHTKRLNLEVNMVMLVEEVQEL